MHVLGACRFGTVSTLHVTIDAETKPCKRPTARGTMHVLATLVTTDRITQRSTDNVTSNCIFDLVNVMYGWFSGCIFHHLPFAMLLTWRTGDSRALVARHDKVLFASKDHKPNDEAERKRIKVRIHMSASSTCALSFLPLSFLSFQGSFCVFTYPCPSPLCRVTSVYTCVPLAGV